MSELHSAQIMGILNITPDSFSDGGRYVTLESALNHIQEFLNDKVDIIDIGAQASGPDSIKISAQEELNRIKPLLEHKKFKETLNRVTYSVDTYHASVADYSLSNGVSIINDISGLRYDPQMTDVICKHKGQVVIMYSKVDENFPHASRTEKHYEDIYETICNFFSERIKFGLSKGLKEEQLILDPGMGMFLSPDPKYSLEIIERASDIKQQFKDFRLLYGVSRKGFLKSITSEEKLDVASKSIENKLIEAGIDIIRTHNTKFP